MVDIDKYSCNLCNFRGVSRQSLYQHKRTKKHLSSIENIDNIQITEISTILHPKCTQQKYKPFCDYCGLEFTRKSSLIRHYNSCKVKKDENNQIKNDGIISLDIKNNNKMDKIYEIVGELKGELSETKEVNREIKGVLEFTLEELNETKEKLANMQGNTIINSINSNNSNNNITHIENMNNINNLNMYFSNVIPMETFLYNMEYVNKITKDDAENLLYSYNNMGIDDLANCFEKIISKNCLEQTKNMDSGGIKFLPALPVLCTDGNLRTHKERLIKSWDTIYNDKHFAKMWDIVNNRVYELTNEYIHVPQKHKKKIYSKIKKKVCIKDLFEMQNVLNL